MRLTWLGENYQHYSLDAVWAEVSARSKWVLLLPVLALGLLFRLLDLGRPYMGYYMWNEVYYVTIARNFEHFGLLGFYNYDATPSALGQRLGPSPLVPWLVYFSSELLGKAEWVSRLPILILGMFSLVLLYLIGRELYGVEVGLGAAFFAAIMPGVIFFSRQVALDGPMTAFGLAAFCTLLFGARRRQYIWVFASSILLGIAIFTKYTAVLFIPSLAYLWLKMLREKESTGKRARWLLPVAYLVIAAVPAATWFVFGLQTTSIHGTQTSWSNYFIRAYEWSPQAWYMAMQVAWVNTRDQVGKMLWYPLVLTVTLVLATGRIPAVFKRYLEVILLIAPWFAQAAYPGSWIVNDNYVYPALYGIALLLGILLRGVLGRARRLLDLPARTLRVSMLLLGIVICLSCLWDYRETYRSWYSSLYSTEFALQLPANLVTQQDPFSSAKRVRSLNVLHQPILADLPATLYYAQDEYWQGRAMWRWWGLGEQVLQNLIADIKGREYSYVVFTYEPPLDIIAALTESGYHRIGPAAWQKTENP